MNGLRLIKNPIFFQGANKKKDYFEGWYFKQVSEDLKTTVSFIPGISLDRNNPHCFIQCILLREENQIQKLETHYFKFELEVFEHSDEPFFIKIGPNLFTENEIAINLKNETICITSKFDLGPFTPIKTSKVHPNIMGYFAYLSFMECYHGIISMNHSVTGTLLINHCSVLFGQGKGYIEKDWGKSFPKEYAWIQSNHFENQSAGIMCSVAHIPFIGTAFLGFICNFVLNQNEYRFATYNRSQMKVDLLDGQEIQVTFTNKSHVLSVHAKMDLSASLIAPKDGEMIKTIKEGLSGHVHVSLQTIAGVILFDQTSECCGIELVNK